jgi:hypothetical protein
MLVRFLLLFCLKVANGFSLQSKQITNSLQTPTEFDTSHPLNLSSIYLSPCLCLRTLNLFFPLKKYYYFQIFSWFFFSFIQTLSKMSHLQKKRLSYLVSPVTTYHSHLLSSFVTLRKSIVTLFRHYLPPTRI